MNINFSPFQIIDKDDNIVLLKHIVSNKRVLLCWFNENTNKISLSLFNVEHRPNSLSRRLPESQWGWITHFIQNIDGMDDAFGIVNMYLKDIQSENYWWELDRIY